MTIATDPDPGATLERERPAARTLGRLLPALPTLPQPGRRREAAGTWLERQIDAEIAARSGFHLIPIGLMVGIALADGAGWRLPWLVIAALAIAFVYLARRLAERPVFRALAFFAGFAVCGMGLATIEIARTTTTIFSGEATVRITGTVAGRERDERGRYRYLVDIARTERPVLSRPPERVRIIVGSRHAPIPIGDGFAGLVRLRPPSGPAMPGAYDFAFAPFFDGVGAYGFSLGAPDAPDLTEVPPQTGIITHLRRDLATIRLAMTERIRDAIGGAAGAIAAALVTGERGGLPEKAEEWLRGTGLAHVLSISGLHMAIVPGFAMLIVRGAIALVPSIALRFQAKKIAAGVALLIAAFYLGVSGANVATQRAFVMLAIMLTAVMLDRPALTLRNVSIAAIVVVALAPHAVLTASFQMSFAATVALIGGYSILSQRRSARRSAPSGMVRKLAAGLLAIALTSLIAGSATGPFSVYHFHRLALFGFVANVLTMPLFTLWIMPLALIGCLLMPLGLETWPFQAMGIGVDWVLRIAEFVYQRLPDQAVGSSTATGLVLLVAAILAAACFASNLRWTALPLLVAGLLLSPNRTPLPTLLIFEDGKEIATVSADEDGEPHLAFLKANPNDFVASQWERTLGIPGPGIGAAAFRRAKLETRCEDDLCLFRTADGLKVAYTANYEQTGAACDAGDIAIVARAIRMTRCRSGAILVTLRTLRRTGSLALQMDASTKRPSVTRSIPVEPEPWNIHRLAAWPEYWKKPKPTLSEPKTAASNVTSDPSSAVAGSKAEASADDDRVDDR